MVTLEFLTREDGTALDAKTGLTWCRYLIGQKWQKRLAVGEPLEIPFSDVAAIIEDFNAQKFGSFSDWRLPSQGELERILVTSDNKKIVSTDRSLFGEHETVFSPSSQNKNHFWTSSSHSAQNSTVDLVVGYYGGKTARTQFASKFARLVRG